MSTDAIERRLDIAHDWLMEWVVARDLHAEAHYRHIQEGQEGTCVVGAAGTRGGSWPCPTSAS